MFCPPQMERRRKEMSAGRNLQRSNDLIWGQNWFFFSGSGWFLHPLKSKSECCNEHLGSFDVVWFEESPETISRSHLQMKTGVSLKKKKAGMTVIIWEVWPLFSQPVDFRLCSLRSVLQLLFDLLSRWARRPEVTVHTAIFSLGELGPTPLPKQGFSLL